MTRTITEGEDASLELDAQAVFEFFEQRAKKAGKLGNVKAVLYQDNTDDLAEQRDAAEKKLLLPKLKVTPQMSILDLGCGTGRWAKTLAPLCKNYVGVDVSPGLIELAKEAVVAPNVEFLVGSVATLDSLQSNLNVKFDLILIFGVLVYLNDTEIQTLVHNLMPFCSENCNIVIREPIGVEKRLVLQNHFSEDMQQTYNAIYRPLAVLLQLISPTLTTHQFKLADSGAVFQQAQLSNRKDTTQHWLSFTR